MTRPIEFRVWDNCYKKFSPLCEGNFSLLHDLNKQLQCCDIMQFTGLLDCNGKKIFEGDYIRDDDGIIHEVYFDGACFLVRPGNSEEISLYAIESIGCEIIGNIYEHHGLIK
jgi:YopX protein